MSEKNIQISLAAARVNAGMTQDDVAKKLHISKKTLVNWEKGKIIPSFVVMNALSDLYQMPINYIFLPTKST